MTIMMRIHISPPSAEFIYERDQQHQFFLSLSPSAPFPIDERELLPQKKKSKEERLIFPIEFHHSSLVEDTSEGEGGIEIEDAFIKACKNGNVDIVKYLMDTYQLDPNLQYNKLTPLIAACNGGQFEIVKFLLSYGADVNLGIKDESYFKIFSYRRKFNNKNCWPLLCACIIGELEIGLYLLQHGSKVIFYYLYILYILFIYFCIFIFLCICIYFFPFLVCFYYIIFIILVLLSLTFL